MLVFNLVGCGRIAQRHAALLGDGLIPGARLGAVCDVKPERAQALASKWGVPWFADYRQMMDRSECHAVSVLTESGRHAEHAISLAEYGKHLVVEKPMALTLESADELIRACDAARVKLFVVKQNRFNRPVVALRRALDAGRFGRLTLGTVRVRWCRTQAYFDQDAWRGTWEFDGGVMANQASHHIDLLEWVMGDVTEVYATTRTALVDIEAEDTAVGVLHFRSGALGIVEATTAARPKDLEGSLSVLGEHGSVEIGGFAVNSMRHWQFDDPEPGDDAARRESENPPDVYGYGHRAYYRHVVKAISEDRPPLVDGLEGRKSLELIQGLYESAATGRPVAMRYTQRVNTLGRAPASREHKP